MSAITAKRDDYFKDRDFKERERGYDPLAKYGRSELSGRLAGSGSDNKLDGKADRAADAGADGQVGYSSLPGQLRRRALRRGFEFNLMAVGESGLGKSTLLNSLFLAELYNAEHLGPSKRVKKTVYVEQHTALLRENGVHLRLGLIDTPGFGDAVDNSNCWAPVVDYIDARFEEQLASEQRVQRGQLVDGRVHCVLYFIAPTGHGLKALDVEFMKRIHDKANVVPVIAKADCLTAEEARDFKKTILNEIAQHKIRVYEFPELPDAGAGDADDDGGARRWKERAPFAVVGANCLVDTKAGKARGRVYPWGVVDAESLEHNDFTALRNLLLRTHMHDMRELTHTLHYENYRCGKLAGIAQESRFRTTDGKDPMTQMETEKRDHEQKMRKMEAEMESVFEMKVKEKRQKLKESEADLQRRSEQMRKQLEQQESELQERRRQFEAEKRSWESGQSADAERRNSMEAPGVEAVHVKEKSKTEKKKGLFK